MKLRQLKIITETVKQNFNLTEVANVLFTSQSGLSKHIKDIEDELGGALFIRKGKRFLSLTEFGQKIFPIMERVLLEIGNIKNIAQQLSQGDQGQIIIATTHTQARYSLPEVISQFTQKFPKVHLIIHQVSPKEIVAMLKANEADIGIATEALPQAPELVTFPYYHWHHVVVVPLGHPLEKTKLSLEEIAEYPIITYHTEFTGRRHIDSIFAQKGLTPDIIISALDADVIKTYVELNLGIGIIASMAYQDDKDNALTCLSAQSLFGQSTTYLAVRRGHFLRNFTYAFIKFCCPKLSEEFIHQQIYPTEDALTEDEGDI